MTDQMRAIIRDLDDIIIDNKDANPNIRRKDPHASLTSDSSRGIIRYIP
jgi:hypothetical protein